MKKFLVVFTVFISVSLTAFANRQEEALKFFNNYVNAANTYSTTIPDFYSPSARIIRQVVKPDGTLVDRETTTARYISEMKKGQAVAKVRKYKNYYSDIKVTKINDNTYKISSLRQPTGEAYKLKAYMVVQKQPDGRWLIIEEMMQTKVQLFLNAK